MEDIEKTRDRLKLDEIEKEDRKDLFNKFVDAGGEVLSDRKKSNHNNPSNLAKKNTFVNNNVSNHLDTKPKREPQFTNRQIVHEVAEKPKNNEIALTIKKSKPPFYNTKLWFNAFASGVITLFGGKVNPKFLNFIDKYVIASLLEMDTLIFNALNPMGINDIDAKNKRDKIIARFAEKLEDVELLERIKAQYDEKVYNNFLRQYKDVDSSVVAVNYVNELKSMFRPLYILHLYVSRMKSVGEKAMMSYAIIDNMSKGIVNSRISAFKRAVDLIYSRYYPKLLILLQYAAKEQLETIDDFNKFFDIKDEDILGYYTKLRLTNQKLNENKIEEVKENIGKKEEEEDEKLNKIESIGVKLIEKCVSFKKADNNIEYETDPFYTVEESDKIYRIKVLIDFLDREYSILFVSNKVKYNSVFDNLVRTDYKADFNNIFLSLSDINSRFNEYSDICRGILKVEQDEGMRFEQRVAMLSERNGQRAYISKNLKSTVSSIISPFKRKLDKLLLDKEEREKIIANPNDILTFFTDIGYKKRVQGYNVLKALTEAYYFVSGFNYLINEGELSGAGLLIDGADLDNEIKNNKNKKEENIKNDNDTNVNNTDNDEIKTENKEENEENKNNQNEENKNNQNEEGVDNDTAFLDDIEIDEDATDIK